MDCHDKRWTCNLERLPMKLCFFLFFKVNYLIYVSNVLQLYSYVEMEFPCILPIKHGHGYGHEIQIQHWYADMVNPKTVW